MGGKLSTGLCIGEELQSMEQYTLKKADIFNNEIVAHYIKKGFLRSSSLRILVVHLKPKSKGVIW